MLFRKSFRTYHQSVAHSFDKASYVTSMSTGEPSEPTIPPPQQEPTNLTRGKGKPLPNIPRKKQASVLDEATPTPAAAIADLIGADRSLSDAGLHNIHDLIGRHLNSRENVLIGDGSDEQQDGDPGPTIPSLISPPTTTRHQGSRSCSRGRLLHNPKQHRHCEPRWVFACKGRQPHPLLCR